MSDPKKQQHFQTMGSGIGSSDGSAASARLKPEVLQLGEHLAKIGVVDKNSFDTVCQTLGAAGDTLGALAALNVAGKLTQYQTDCIREGLFDKLQFDDYLIIDKLGEGGMGEVFKAKNKVLGRVEAIKTVLHIDDPSGALLKRFQQEARVLARMVHPAIVPIYRIGRVGTTDYIAMKYVEGEDLKARVDRVRSEGETIPVRQACRWIMEAADALDHAHQQNVIHRDIKPSNIMLTKGGNIFVLDMGIARLTDPTDPANAGSGLTAQNRGLGTPDFMPPEQWADATAVVPASDIYALGCTLFFTLTGRVPFKKEAGRLVELMRAHATEPPPNICELRPDVSPELRAVIDRMLAKRPEDRYASGKEVVEALRPFAATGQTLTGSQFIRVPPAKPRSVLPIFITTFAVAALFLAGSFAWSRIQKPDVPPVKKETAEPISKESPKEVVHEKPIEKAPPPVDYRGRFEEFLADSQRKNADVWKSPKELKQAIEAAGLDVARIDSRVRFDELQKSVEGLSEAKRKQMTKPQTPPWLVAYQQSHAKEWPSLAVLTAFVEQEMERAGSSPSLAAGESLAKPGAALFRETARRRRERILREIEQWLVSFQKDHETIWDDPVVFREAVRELSDLGAIENDQQFEAFQNLIAKETTALAEPFKDVNYDGVPAKDQKLAEVAVAALKEILAVQSLKRDPAFTIKGSYVDAQERSVTRAKVNEPVFLSFTPSQDAFVTPVQFDERTLIVLKIDAKWTAGDTAILKNDFRFSTAGKKLVALYATDEPLLKDLPFIHANYYAHLALEKRDDFAALFAGKFTHDRILWSLQLGTPMPGVPQANGVGRWTRDLVELTVEP